MCLPDKFAASSAVAFITFMKAALTLDYPLPFLLFFIYSSLVLQYFVLYIFYIFQYFRSLHEELFRLRHVMGMKDGPIMMMHSPPHPPEARYYPTGHKALPPLQRDREFWKAGRR